MCVCLTALTVPSALYPLRSCLSPGQHSRKSSLRSSKVAVSVLEGCADYVGLSVAASMVEMPAPSLCSPHLAPGVSDLSLVLCPGKSFDAD